MSNIATCLWYDSQAEEAARFYVSLLPNSRIDRINRSPANNPSTPEGAILLVEFTLDGQHFIGLNGGPPFQLTEAVSISISVEGQAEVDRLWNALVANGGKPSQCGWLKDRWGLSWQIVPTALPRLLGSPDRDGARRAMQAMLEMGEIDIAALERAFAGKS